MLPFRSGVASLVALLLSLGSALAQSGADLSTGLKQVKDGDFAGAIATLDPIARGVAGNADAGEMSQAHLQLGMAFIGLVQDAKAHQHFKDALQLDPVLRLAEGRHPAKVFEAFEAARKELQREHGTNAIGDATRFTEVSARIEVATPAGTFIVATPDRLRIDFP